MAERHSVSLKISRRLAEFLGWVENASQVGADLTELMRALMLMCAGNTASPHTIKLGGETFRFATGPIFENFLTQSAAGKKWPKWSKAYAASRKDALGKTKKGTARKGKILTGSGKLWKEATSARSLDVQYAAGKVTGTLTVDSATLPYAKIHDEGGTIPRHYVAPVRAKALCWMWMAPGGKLMKGPFFSRGHYVGPTTIPKRTYYTIGRKLNRRWKTTFDRVCRAWMRGLFLRGGAQGAGMRTAFEVH